ncbi:MAG: hypothetical protein ACO32I_08990 [Candidatus Limnocylindrus sp.]
MTGSDDGAAAGEEMALEPTAEENALLVSIADPDLREALLLGVLRSPPGESVLVQVNVRMAESDGFCGARLPELLQNGMFEDAYLHRAGCEAVMSFELTCPACPALSRSYVGDDVQDKLLEFFAKELIRFKPSTCMQASALRCIGGEMVCKLSIFVLCCRSRWRWSLLDKVKWTRTVLRKTIQCR